MLLAFTIFSCKKTQSNDSQPHHTQVAATTLDEFFAEDTLHRIDLKLDPNALEALRDAPRSYVDAKMNYGGIEYPVSIKLKGHRSFRKIDDKPALKIRFDKVNTPKGFLGLRRLTLNNMVDDPTRMRESLGYKMYEAAQVPAPRTTYASIRINERDLGIYLALEPIDKRFVAKRLGEPIGGLYEAEYGCDFYPDDIETFEQDGGPKKARARLKKVAEAVAANEDELLASSSRHFDSDRVVSYLAMSTLLGDFDGYWHSHNYYLYEQGPGGKWMLLPWGIDRVFNDKVRTFGSHGRLAERCFSDPSCRLRYSKRLLELADIWERAELDKEMRRLATLLGPAPRDDQAIKRQQKKKRLMRDYIRRRPAEIRTDLSCIVQGREVDEDGDGYGCNDCESTDPKIHPGALEVCDRIDNDCNGFVDDSPDCSCDTTTVEGVEFHMCRWRFSWHEAKAFCSSKGLSLAQIDSKVQSEHLYKRAMKLDDNRWWLGASDLAEEGTWISERSGLPLSFSHWDPGQPNNNQCGQHCASLDDVEEGRWVDSHCEQNFPFICR